MWRTCWLTGRLWRPLAAWDTVEAKSVSFGWRRRRRSALWCPRKSPVGVVRTRLSRVIHLRPLPGSVSQCYSALWWTEQQKDTREQLRERCLVYASQVTPPCVSTFWTNSRKFLICEKKKEQCLKLHFKFLPHQIILDQEKNQRSGNCNRCFFTLHDHIWWYFSTSFKNLKVFFVGIATYVTVVFMETSVALFFFFLHF